MQPWGHTGLWEQEETSHEPVVREDFLVRVGLNDPAHRISLMSQSMASGHGQMRGQEDVASAAPGCLGVSVCERERETTVGVEM